VSAQTVHILLVEDEEAHAELVHRGVKSCGGSIRLTVARSLQEARAKLQVFSPDLLIADLKLPDGSGLELLPPENEKPSYPIVMLTSHGDETSAVAALKGGAMDYLVKSAATLSDIPFIAGRILREWGHIPELKRAEEGLYRKTRLIKLLQEVAVAANEAKTVENALQMALEIICAHTGWPVGHVYLPADDGTGKLAPSGIWHLGDHEKFGTFRKITEATRFASGIGLPGRVLSSGKAAWIVDVTQDPNFPRARIAADIGVRAGSAFPVIVGKELVAVLEFFSDKVAEPDGPLLEVMAHVGTQLGRVVERKWAEEALQKAHEELELRVKERTADLSKTNAALKEQITERKQAEQALRQGKHKYESLMNQSPDPIFVSRIDDFRFTEVSDRACENYGYSREEFLTMEIFDIEIEAPLRHEVRDLYRKMDVGKVIEVYGTNRRKDGSTFPVQVRFTKLDNEYAVAVVRDITARKEAEDRIAASLKEKELLLKEVHHRVKNNLQIISSILDLQCENIKSEAGLEMIRGCQHRIHSIALIHEGLCQTDSLSKVDFSRYIQSLTMQLFDVFGPPTDSIQLKMNLQNDVLLSIDTAIPCGLILHELVSNALKYAFPESRRGEVRIELYSDTPGRLNLIVADDGVGLPNSLDFRKTETLGLQLVNTLVDQLDGCIDLHNGSGTEFKIQFPYSKGF